MIFDTDILSKEELKDLHAGELTSIMLCKREGMAFVTNDNKAKRFCKENAVEWLDIVDILRLCYRKHVLDRREIENVIRDMEEKDRTRITRKASITSHLHSSHIQDMQVLKSSF